MLIERRARAQKRRMVRETIARFIAECRQGQEDPMLKAAGRAPVIESLGEVWSFRSLRDEPLMQAPPGILRWPEVSGCGSGATGIQRITLGRA